MNTTPRTAANTAHDPADWFTGDVYIDPISSPDSQTGCNLSSAHVHFTPGARTAWHNHPNGQLLFVTDGVGYVGRRDGSVQEIRQGDSVWIEPGEDHWHGAAPDHFMAHVATLQVDEQGNGSTWLEHVSDEEYRGDRK